MGIKDFSIKQASLYEYTWDIVTCMVITSKEYSDPNIWLETPNQNTGIKDMILRKLSKEAIK